MDIIQKLEEFKQCGNYAVNLFYGEGIGCDDSDVTVQDRRVRITGIPVGCVGEARIIWSGKVSDLEKANFTDKSNFNITAMENPPTTEERITLQSAEGKMFTFGSENGVKHTLGAWKKEDLKNEKG